MNVEEWKTAVGLCLFPRVKNTLIVSINKWFITFARKIDARLI